MTAIEPKRETAGGLEPYFAAVRAEMEADAGGGPLWGLMGLALMAGSAVVAVGILALICVVVGLVAG